MHRIFVIASAVVACFLLRVNEAPAQQAMPVHQSLAAEFDQAKLDGSWIVTFVETDGDSTGVEPQYSVGNFITLSADVNVGRSQVIGRMASINERTNGGTYMKKIDQQAIPRQIDVVVELRNVFAHYRDEIVPQEMQIRRDSMKTLNGIYRLSKDDAGEDRLTWCFSKYGSDRPENFMVHSNSGRTLLTLKRSDSILRSDWTNSTVTNSLSFRSENESTKKAAVE